MSTLLKRIEALEKQFGSSEPLRLAMPDGKVETIRQPSSRRGGMLRFYGELLQGQHPHEAELIRDAVSYNEPGGGRMVELCRAMLDCPPEVRNGGEQCDLDRSE